MENYYNLDKTQYGNYEGSRLFCDGLQLRINYWYWETLIDFRLDDVGDVGIIETDIDVSGSDLAMQLSK